MNGCLPSLHFSISVFTLEHNTAANPKNFSTDKSSTFDESISAAGIDSSDTEIDEMVREAIKKTAQQKKRSITKTATEGIFAFQMEQFNYQKEQDQKFETMLRNTFEQQRQMDAEERQIDRDFFLKLGKTFSRSKKLFSASELQYIIAIKYTEIRCPKEVQEPNLYRYKRLASYISLDVLKLYLWCVYKTQNRFV